MAGQAAGLSEEIGAGLISRNSVVGTVTSPAVPDFGMPPHEFRTGFFMVEFGRIPIYEGRILALMIDMAGCTVLAFIPMKTAPGRHTLGDLPMTAQALGGNNLEILIVALHAGEQTRGIDVHRTEGSGGVVGGVFLGESPQVGKKEQQEGDDGRGSHCCEPPISFSHGRPAFLKKHVI
jgi:hypothetical protein